MELRLISSGEIFSVYIDSPSYDGLSFIILHKKEKLSFESFLTRNVLDSLSIQIAMLADKVLNFWVRDGTRCDHFSIITGS